MEPTPDSILNLILGLARTAVFAWIGLYFPRGRFWLVLSVAFSVLSAVWWFLHSGFQLTASREWGMTSQTIGAWRELASYVLGWGWVSSTYFIACNTNQFRWLNSPLSLFSFSGRFLRRDFWLVFLSIWIPNLRSQFFIDSNPGTDAAHTLLIVTMIACAVVYLPVWIAAHVRRWHDLGKSGLWMLIYLVPLIGALLAIAELGFRRGEKGQNRFGPEPDPQTS